MERPWTICQQIFSLYLIYRGRAQKQALKWLIFNILPLRKSTLSANGWGKLAVALNIVIQMFVNEFISKGATGQSSGRAVLMLDQIQSTVWGRLFVCVEKQQERVFSQSAHLIRWRRQAVTSVALTSSVIAAVRRQSGKKHERKKASNAFMSLKNFTVANNTVHFWTMFS